MLRGLLHPSEYKEILFQVSQQPTVTYGQERRLSDIRKERLKQREEELREKIRNVKSLSESVSTVKKMAVAVRTMSKVAKESKEMPSEGNTISDKKRRARLILTVVQAFKGGRKSQTTSDESKSEVQNVAVRTMPKVVKESKEIPSGGITVADKKRRARLILTAVQAFKSGRKSRNCTDESKIDVQNVEDDVFI